MLGIRLSNSSALFKRQLINRRFSAAIVEHREYIVKPEFLSQYLSLTNDTATLRNKLAPLRLFCVPETGGRLNAVSHFYCYEDGITARESARAKMVENKEWQAYLLKAKPCLVEQRSFIYVEPSLSGMMGMKPMTLGSLDETNAIYEIRTYKLKLGYDTVPKFLEYYASGLPSKLSAPGTDPTTRLCTVMYNEVGRLNTVIEVWRHGGGTTAMNTSRIAARSAADWRKAISEIANLAIEFRNTIHRPTVFSNWM
mmetsp:Transcript_26188/g.26431  ORF Transcript_26188/g.26431 Transcript_26188/m.26431 type:complete len:254 (+) Transcript_26188:84-845(+)